MPNKKHIFIKDNDGQSRTALSSNAKSYNSSNSTSDSDNRKRTEEHIIRKQKELDEDNKRRIENKEVNKKSTGETGRAANINKSDNLDESIKEKEKSKISLVQNVMGFPIGKNYKGACYNLAKELIGPDTAGMLDMAHEKRNDPAYTKEAIELDNWDDYRVASDKVFLKKKISKEFRDYNFNINDIPGYFFKNNSEPSKRIAKDPDFLKKIKEDINKIINTKDGTSMEFPNYGKNRKSNLHYALGHIDIKNGHYDKDGNLHVKIYDTYDFNKDNQNPLNQAGRAAMMKGELKPFFTIHDIFIPKEDLE